MTVYADIVGWQINLTCCILLHCVQCLNYTVLNDRVITGIDAAVNIDNETGI